MQQLIKAGPKDLRLRTDSDGNIPIMAAIDTGNVYICHGLLSENLEEQISYTKVSFHFDTHAYIAMLNVF
jgi:hypothetical protein